jgi:hypothetical protein
MCLGKYAILVRFTIDPLIRKIYYGDTCMAFLAVNHLKDDCKNDVAPMK